MVTRLKRSCLLMVSWFFVGLAVIFFVGNGYVMVRMTQAQTKIDRLAAQLGYTPDNRVSDGSLVTSDFNPFTGSQAYGIGYYFTTPLDATTLPARLQELKLRPRKVSMTNESKLLVYANPKVNGIPAHDLQAQGTLPVVPYYIWLMDIGASVDLHETSVLDAPIELAGKAFSDNYVELQVSGVHVQLWMLPGLILWARIQGYRY